LKEIVFIRELEGYFKDTYFNVYLFITFVDLYIGRLRVSSSSYIFLSDYSCKETMFNRV